MPREKLNQEQREELINLYKTGEYSASKLSKMFPLTSSAIGDMLKRYNVPIKTNFYGSQKYQVKEDFFDIIDTEEKAYILGLLYADGCNTEEQSNTVSLSLIEPDKYILETINNLIQPSRPITSYMPKGFTNAHRMFTLTINNKKVSIKLAKLGMMRRKTFKLKFPDISIITRELRRHFIRGYFDGDGCITGTNMVPKSGILGTIDFLEGVQNVLYEEIGLSITKILLDKRMKGEIPIARVSIGGRRQNLRFRDWLYKDATIYLKRKFDKFNNIVPLHSNVLDKLL